MRWQPALELLHGCSSLVPLSCAEMLRLAVPLALATPKDERHSFQNAIIGVLASLHAKEEHSRREGLEAVESGLLKLVTDRDNALSEIEAVSADHEVSSRDKEAKGAEVQAHIAAVEDATVKLESEQMKVAQVQEQISVTRQMQHEFQQRVTGVWEQLMANSFDPVDWRLREKAVEGVVDCLQLADVEPSLLAALPVVLKRDEPPEERNDFAVQAIERANLVLKSHLEKLTTQIEELEEEAKHRLEIAAAAEAELQKANAILDQTSTASVEAHNAWISVDEKVRELKTAIHTYPQQEMHLSTRRRSRRATLETFQGLVVTFEQMVEGVAADLVPKAPAMV